MRHIKPLFGPGNSVPAWMLPLETRTSQISPRVSLYENSPPFEVAARCRPKRPQQLAKASTWP